MVTAVERHGRTMSINNISLLVFCLIYVEPLITLKNKCCHMTADDCDWLGSVHVCEFLEGQVG